MLSAQKVYCVENFFSFIKILFFFFFPKIFQKALSSFLLKWCLKSSPRSERISLLVLNWPKPTVSTFWLYLCSEQSDWLQRTTTEAQQFIPTGTQDHCHKWLALQGEFGSDFGSGFTCTQGDVRASGDVSWGSRLCHLPAQLPVHCTTPRHPGAFLQKKAALPSPRGLKGSTRWLEFAFQWKSTARRRERGSIALTPWKRRKEEDVE